MKFEELKNRREALLSIMPEKSIAILSSAYRNYRTKDVENPYRQNSDFLYMTGINEPNLLNMIYREGGKNHSILFRNNTTDHEKVWEGIRLDNNEILERYGFTEIHNYDEYQEKISSFLEKKENIYIDDGINKELDIFLSSKLLDIGNSKQVSSLLPKNKIALSKIIHKMRLVKSDYEIELMKNAAQVSILAHEQAMKKSKPGIYEYELDAEIKYIFNKHNMHFAYMSIVGGGDNACTLHYIKNNHLLKNNELVLIDAAAENKGYASDITRTFPVNGKFTQEQALIYDIVLSAQEKAIEFLRPGVTWDKVHEISVKEISQGLINLSILPDDIEIVINDGLYKEFFMHKTGHWIGLDVHDVGDYEGILFEPGMVITVEPGIYISSSNKNVEKKWRGIGVRIEDDVLITSNGCEVITKKLAKKRDEVEAICSRKNE
ncbi:aminopeptidase P N-terminal domain-containing protein [Gammaproteobacteria bacterium]|nr:aminopeptidase P N-terminal domain-containing protein [Gammaproteobacteria bacterium]